MMMMVFAAAIPNSSQFVVSVAAARVLSFGPTASQRRILIQRLHVVVLEHDTYCSIWPDCRKHIFILCVGWSAI